MTLSGRIYGRWHKYDSGSPKSKRTKWSPCMATNNRMNDAFIPTADISRFYLNINTMKENVHDTSIIWCRLSTVNPRSDNYVSFAQLIAANRRVISSAHGSICKSRLDILHVEHCITSPVRVDSGPG